MVLLVTDGRFRPVSENIDFCKSHTGVKTVTVKQEISSTEISPDRKHDALGVASTP